jgi:Arc/MetJ-type ribon-helix-helix transcriptional regulator
MKYERIEVRLDPEHLKKVSDLKAAYGTSASEAVRRAIDDAYEKVMLERRLEAVRRIAAANLEDVPDIETIKGQSGRSNDPAFLDPLPE